MITPMVLLSSLHLSHASLQLQLPSEVADKHVKNSISLFYSHTPFFPNIAFPHLITQIHWKCLQMLLKLNPYTKDEDLPLNGLF